MIDAELPRSIASTFKFYEKDRETESQQGITKTTHVETSISTRTNPQEQNVLHPGGNLQRVGVEGTVGR